VGGRAGRWVVGQEGGWAGRKVGGRAGRWVDGQVGEEVWVKGVWMWQPSPPNHLAEEDPYGQQHHHTAKEQDVDQGAWGRHRW
jgi:hypothetical protein